jgi:hypothetical protein
MFVRGAFRRPLTPKPDAGSEVTAAMYRVINGKRILPGAPKLSSSSPDHFKDDEMTTIYDDAMGTVGRTTMHVIVGHMP